MERHPPADVVDLRLLGGAVCLDLVNTLDPRDAPQPRDLLRDDAAAVRWLEHVGLIGDADREAVGAVGLRDELAALREQFYSVFAAVARSQALEAGDLRRFTHTYRQALATCDLRASDAGLAFVPSADETVRARVVAELVLSAAALLFSPLQGRVRECAAHGECGWLFVDRTRSGTRRWCRMDGCGNRAKARRHRAGHGRDAAATSRGG